MNQSRTNLGKVPSKVRSLGRSSNPEMVTSNSSSPLDALVRGLASIGERFFKAGLRSVSLDG